MKKAKLLSTVAAALLFGVGAASAQGMSKDTPERAPAAQQNAPAEKVAPAMKNGDHKAPQTTGQATPDGKSGKAKETTGQAPKSEPKSDMGQRGPGGAPQESSPANGRRRQVEIPNNKPAASPSTKSSSEQNRATTGQGAAGSAKLEHRAAHQDQFDHQRAEGGTGKSERVGNCRDAYPGKRARAPVTATGHRDLSGVARLRLHSGR